MFCNKLTLVEQLEYTLSVEGLGNIKTQLAEEVPEDLLRNPKLFLDDSYYDSARLQAYCDRIMACARRRSATTWRVCSFSATHEHPLLWAHYADSHRGICIEFDASNHADFGSALPVQYVDERPTVHWFRATGLQNISMLTTKSSDWRYEQEYRLIGREPYRGGEGAEVHDKIFGFRKNRITGVILGSRIDRQRRQMVERWLRDHQGVRVSQAVLDETDYKLHFVNISAK